MKRWIYMLCAVLALAGLTGCERKENTEFLLEEGEETVPEEALAPDSESEEEEKAVRETEAGEPAGNVEPTVCYVHICGAVKVPGVYRMESGGRIFQAVEMAGGFTEDACQDYVNQAEEVKDGLKIRVPTLEEAEQISGTEKAAAGAGLEYPQGAGGAQEQGQSLVNINTATEAELCTLTGIGASRAKAVMDYREQHGGFQKKEDIMKVPGIKQSSYDKIKDHITV